MLKSQFVIAHLLHECTDKLRESIFSVNATTGWMIGVRFPTRAGNFSLRHRLQTDSGAHTVKRPEREADHSLPSSAEVKECVELYLHSPIRLHGVVLS
jgi:hypothetical protein